MIKTTFLALAFAALTFTSVQAKTMKVPSEDFAIASVKIPDSWEPTEIDNGVVGTSPDKAVYLSVVGVGSEKGMNAELESTFAMLKEHKVDLNQSSKKENKFKINGLDAEEMLFQGKDEDGPAAVSITFVTVKDKLLVLTYWVSTEEEAKHSKEVSAILESLKPVS